MRFATIDKLKCHQIGAQLVNRKTQPLLCFRSCQLHTRFSILISDYSETNLLLKTGAGIVATYLCSVMLQRHQQRRLSSRSPLKLTYLHRESKLDSKQSK
jgi:hypothetical protein